MALLCRQPNKPFVSRPQGTRCLPFIAVWIGNWQFKISNHFPSLSRNAIHSPATPIAHLFLAFLLAVWLIHFPNPHSSYFQLLFAKVFLLFFFHSSQNFCFSFARLSLSVIDHSLSHSHSGTLWSSESRRLKVPPFVCRPSIAIINIGLGFRWSAWVHHQRREKDDEKGKKVHTRVRAMGSKVIFGTKFLARQ